MGLLRARGKVDKETQSSVTESTIHNSIFQDITHFGIRLIIGVIYIVHSIGKFEPEFADVLLSMGLPPELHYLVALGELIPGILLIVGGLTRISAMILSIILMGVMFIVKGPESFTGENGVEFHIMILAGCLSVIVLGPGRISISQVLKKIPRILQ